VFVGIQLSWLDANGARPIRHVAAAFEAVADAGGGNIVYVEAEVGKLHWIGAEDEDLGISGSQPALSDDGRTLAFLSPEGSLEVYDRATRTVRQLDAETYSTLALGGGALFAVTSDRRLVRFDLSIGASSTWLEPFPEIDSGLAPTLGLSLTCPLICYGPQDRGFALGRGMVFVLTGRFLDQKGWRARSAGVDIPLHPLSDRTVWLQIPSDLARTDNTQAFEIYNPTHPLKFSEAVQIQDRVVACLGTLHQDFSRLVSTDDRAAPGEIVHAFLTGLPGAEPVADGVANPLDHLIAVADPPEFTDSGAADVLFFGLAPGEIGIQQLDMRLRRAFMDESSLFQVNSFGCAPPPVF
jgi:uncharacterized protein (TIGR03437 family)